MICKFLNYYNKPSAHIFRVFNCISYGILIIFKALECDLLNDLLSILDSPLQEVESPAGCKALIVKAVKAMQCSLLYGEQISAILKESQVRVIEYYGCPCSLGQRTTTRLRGG